MKKSISILTTSLAIAASLVSCTKDRAGEYDTPATPGPLATSPTAAVDPAASVYDTPPAYQETSTNPTASVPTAPETLSTLAPEPTVPTVVPSPTPRPTVIAPVTPPPANGAAIIHTVVAGDTLSGISAKYKVPKASIKTANRMTSDIVVLGRKMVIPPQ